MAEAFLTGPLRDGLRECIRKSDQARVRFDPQTTEIGVVTKDGKINTYMLATPLRSSSQTPTGYFESQCF